MSLTRRELCLMLPALLPAVAIAEDLSAQDASLPSATWTYEQLPVDTSPGGAETRPVVKGKLATGELLEVHETVLPPGGMPHPGHHHVHSEMWLVREGTVELNINAHAIGLGRVV